MATPTVHLKNAEQSANVLKTIAHPIRLSIIELLSRPGIAPKRVSDIVAELDKPQAIISQHLIHLKDRGVLTSTKAGTNIFYRPAVQGLDTVVRAILVLTPPKQ
jgi:DNA-binding transcriptional ArsR family regulator